MDCRASLLNNLTPDMMERSIVSKVYDIQNQDGCPQAINIVHLNTNYKFQGIWLEPSHIVKFARDESCLVLSVEMCTIIDAFKYFEVNDLEVICNYHVITHNRIRRAALLELMLKHRCDKRCGGYLYVFRCLRSGRINVLEKLGVPVVLTMPQEYGRESVSAALPQNTPMSISETQTPASTSSVEDQLGDMGHLNVVSDDQKLEIIREWQREMCTAKLALVTCAVCSIRTSKANSKLVHAKDINLDVLTNEELPQTLLPNTYDLAVYRFAILNPDGLEFKDRLGNMTVCSRCLVSLSVSVMPKFALSNWLYYAREALPQDVKDAFTSSSIFERMLICRARSNSVTCRFNSRGKTDSQDGAVKDDNGQPSQDGTLARARKGIRGNILVTPLDTLKMNNIIPPPATIIRDTMSAIFLGKGLPTQSNIKQYSPVLVRRIRVKVMIEFLLANNPHYSVSEAFKYSPSNLQGMVNGTDYEDNVPAAVYVGHLGDNDAIASATSDYTNRNTILDNDGMEDGDLLMENVGYTEGDHSPISYRHMKNVALERCLAGKPFIGSGSGSELVPDFDNASLLTWLFPHLDPWGIGGFHHPKRKTKISMIEQLRHLLLIDDDVFEKDPEFAFATYNVVRKSKVSHDMRFSVPARTHSKILKDLLKLDPEVVNRLNIACEKDPYYKPVEEGEIAALRCLSSVRMVSRHVPGSDGYKTMMRNEIRGLMNYKGTPALFITLNPSDVDNPIVRLLAGDDIVLEDVTRGEDMNKWKRSLFAARNPSACARFFDLMITAFIKVILRYGRNEPGLYGRCTSYYGTVEAQGKGTLHCHLLVWLEGHVSPQRLRDLMTASDIYRDSFLKWLESVIKCEFPFSSGVQSQRDLHPRRILHHENGDPHPGVVATPLADEYTGPDEFWTDYARFVQTLVHHYEWHEHTPTCWKYLERGQEKNDKNCRVGMNGNTEDTSTFNSDTLEIILRRHHPSIASYTDVVLFLMRCNMDIKYVGTGDAAKAFVYYVTDYITKASLTVHAGMAVLLHALKKLQGSISDISDQNAVNVQAVRSVISAVNNMMGRQEISHPQVMSYIVGGGDHYKSDKFSILQWGLIRQTCISVIAISVGEAEENFAYEGSLSLVLEDNGMTVCSQYLDYKFRSSDESFESLCLYDFVALTSKSRFPRASEGYGHVNHKGSFIDGRHSQYLTHYLVRGRQYRIPVLLGPCVPNPSRSVECREEWSRDILLLFKPWRDVRELKPSDQTWTAMYGAYEPFMRPEHKKIASNMFVTTECAEARDQHRERRRGNRTDDTVMDNGVGDVLRNYEDDPNQNLIDKWDTFDPFEQLDPVDDEEWICSKPPGNVVDDETYSLLDACYPERHDDVKVDSAPQKMGKSDALMLEELANFMAQKKKRKSVVSGDVDVREAKRPCLSTGPLSEWMKLGIDIAQINRSGKYAVANMVIDEMGLRCNPEQLRAFHIIAEHIIEEKKDQLMMHVSGVGGTGKSHLIKSIVKLFEGLKMRSRLILGAPTGIAAVLIQGQTLHSLILASPNGKSNDMSALADVWRSAILAIVDEVSMLGAKFMSDLSSRVKLARGDHIVDREKPFGGINMVFMGDFGQLKPPKQAALYSSHLVKNPYFPESRNNDGISALNGAFIWRQVKTVVELVKNQRQADDPEYGSFLNRVRLRQCVSSPCPGILYTDMQYLCTRLMSTLSLDVLKDFWDAPIIVGSKALRDILNAKLVKYNAKRLGSELATYLSCDIVDKTLVKGVAQTKLWGLPSSENKEAFGRLPLFVGMKVMVTENLAFDNGIVNGTEGIVREIKYEEDDCGRRYAKVVYIWVPGCGMNIDGLENDVVPIFPTSVRLHHSLPNTKSSTFTRKQVPLVPAYVYTDFKAQGRTADRVIVDLTTARGQSAYVMLSRVRSLSGLVILRWFPPSRIYQRMPEELRDELDRLSVLNQATQASYRSSW